MVASMTSDSGTLRPVDRALAPLRIGAIVPSVNTVVEPWFSSVVPRHVTIHTSRMLLADTLSADKVIEMDRLDGARAILQIAGCRPASVAYCCTASSLVQGRTYDAHLRQDISARCGAPATTGAHAITCALETLAARSICVVSPYTDEVDALEHRYFEEAGFNVVAADNLGIADTFRLAEPEPDVLFELAMRAWKAEAEALVITCLNTHSHAVIDRLERRLGKPVVTSTQATLWHALKLAGCREPIERYGRLFQH